jgi:FPC/CPF motif-containing protein YcgG
VPQSKLTNYEKSKVVRLNEYAYNRLRAAHAALEKAIERFPERYPCHAGRRLTLSDVVVLSLEGKGEVE